MIEPQDLPVLAYLEDIAAEYLEENARRSFRLIFRFSENPYFDPTTLVKTYHVEAEGSSDVLASTESTEILWKPGKDVTKKNVTKKQKNKRKFWSVVCILLVCRMHLVIALAVHGCM